MCFIMNLFIPPIEIELINELFYLHKGGEMFFK